MLSRNLNVVFIYRSKSIVYADVNFILIIVILIIKINVFFLLRHITDNALSNSLSRNIASADRIYNCAERLKNISLWVKHYFKLCNIEI